MKKWPLTKARCMLNLIIAEDVELDLIDIGNHTESRWGIEQREKYIAGLVDRFYWLIENPNDGKKQNEIKEGYYSYHQGRHEIFYTFDQIELTVLAVLHERMDFKRHL